MAAGGGSSDCHIVPTRDSHSFRFRVRLASPEDDGHPAQLYVQSRTVVAGRKCYAFYNPLVGAGFNPAPTSTSVVFSLLIVNHPLLEASAKVSTHMVLLDKTGSPAPSIGAGKTLDNSIGGGGYVLRAERDDVRANCVVDDHLVVLCSVDIDWTPPASSLEEELPDLGHDLAIMSEKQEHTDVSFDVGGESFSAHRLVLAARSPVFKAELYGPMAESKMTSITIQDMDASTFKSMLHYLYHGSLPNNVAGNRGVSFTVAEYQRLLVAAERYGIERLKKICEAKLSAGGITIDTVVSMLELAEDHVCSELKARCLDFLADGENLKMVATSGEYLHLMQSFPNLLVEARNRFKAPHEKPTIVEPGSNKKTQSY